MRIFFSRPRHFLSFSLSPAAAMHALISSIATDMNAPSTPAGPVVPSAPGSGASGAIDMPPVASSLTNSRSLKSCSTVHLWPSLLAYSRTVNSTVLVPLCCATARRSVSVVPANTDQIHGMRRRAIASTTIRPSGRFAFRTSATCDTV